MSDTRDAVDLVQSIDAKRTDRRKLLAKAGLIGAAAVGASLLGNRRQTTALATDVALFKNSNGVGFRVNAYDILNFALNLEYLEAEFYLRATTGSGLPDSMTGGVGSTGAVTGGAQVTFSNPIVQAYANEIAEDEKNHVAFLRDVLGARAVARPAIDFTAAFNAAASVAGIATSFDPFSNDGNFLIGSFTFEDVGVTAYHGASTYIANDTVLSAAAGILAVEAYHAGIVRSTIYSLGINMPAPELIAAADLISNLREKASDAAGQPIPTDEGVTVNPNSTPNIVPTDENSVAFSRTFSQVLNIVYLNTTAKPQPGGFFPNGLNGRIN